MYTLVSDLTVDCIVLEIVAVAVVCVIVVAVAVAVVCVIVVAVAVVCVIVVAVVVACCCCCCVDPCVLVLMIDTQWLAFSRRSDVQYSNRELLLSHSETIIVHVL